MSRIGQFVAVMCEDCRNLNRPGAVGCEFCHAMLEPYRLDDLVPEELRESYELEG